MNYNNQNSEICQRIRESIPIQDYAAARGFKIVRKGSYYGIEGAKGKADFSSVMIKPSTNRYCRYSVHNRWHSIIDFVCELDNCSEAEAINTLKPYIESYDVGRAEIGKAKIQRNNPEREKISMNNLPERADTLKHAKAYLLQSRHINKNIVDDFIYNGNLYEDEHKNCVFVNYNRAGEPTYCNKRGTNTYVKNGFKWEHPGNDYKHCFYIDNGADTLIVSEAVIDTMSVMSIMEDVGRKINAYDYVALGGTGKWEAVGNILTERPTIRNVVLCCDNDESGFTAMDNIKTDILKNHPNVSCTEFLPKTENDWNAQLQMIREHSISSAQYLHLSSEELLQKATIKPIHELNRERGIMFELTKGGV